MTRVRAHFEATFTVGFGEPEQTPIPYEPHFQQQNHDRIECFILFFYNIVFVLLIRRQPLSLFEVHAEPAELPETPQRSLIRWPQHCFP